VVLLTAPTLTVPERLTGYVDEASFYSILGDVLEHVGDMVWPTSVPVLAQMRRDPQLAAILKAYTLLIRRATWAVDPAGCRPEIARMIADDLGLPLVGEDTAGPARVAGVSWRRHLQAALSHLTFGHSAFELLADTSSGQARLVGLAERMQHTIRNIRVDPGNGELLGIDQDARAYTEKPQIPAEHLAWYALEREGANYQGQSMLRPAYGAFILKREMLKVLATGNRRFSMGVPTVEWDNNVQPTPAQMAEAQRAASASRVGDQSGMSMPPGAHLKLVGLTGSAPDTLSFVKFLDQQMSRMALAGHLDLAETSNGSRALGDAFLELLLMAQQSIADDVADDATRQISARIVSWNWTDEPVPRIVCGDVGARADVTADAIAALLGSGALTADPELEAYLRRRFRLPQRTSPAPLPTPPVNAPPVQAARRRAPKRKEPAPGQLSLRIAAAADDGQPDFAAIQQDWETARTDLQRDWPAIAGDAVADLAAAATGAVVAGVLAGLGALAVTPAVVTAAAATVATAMTALAVIAAGHAAAEAAALGIEVADAVPDADRITGLAEAFAGQIFAGYATAAGRKALTLAAPDATASAVEADVIAHLDAITIADSGLVNDGLGAALSAAQNTGRAAVFAQLDDVVFVADETLDPSTCAVCRAADGTRYETWAEAAAAYPTGGNAGCLGGLRCRGLIRVQLP
jgi:hypothetical protein